MPCRGLVRKPDTSRDVEQKFIYPLLTALHPAGFGIRSSAIVTKANVRRFEIEKGNQRKTYYPDYVIAIGGYPLAVIEAKAPGIDLSEAFRESRLYANELNALYPAGMNPVLIVCATNANHLWFGTADQTEPTLTLDYADVESYSNGMAEAQLLLGISALQERFRTLNEARRSPRYFTFRSRRPQPSHCSGFDDHPQSGSS